MENGQNMRYNSQRFHKKKHLYWQLSQHKQRDAFISLRQQIRAKSGLYGGQFISPHILNEPDIPAIYCQWADAYFLGTDGHTIWNATIVTTAREFWDIVKEMADSREWEMLTIDEQLAERDIKFEPIWSNGQRMYRMIPRPKLTYEKFGGLTFFEYQEKLVNDIIQHEPPEIFESFTIDRCYRYGIGLQIVIHADVINQATIEEAIRRFREGGENNWLAAQPVLRNELPLESANAAFSKTQWKPTEDGK
jgi:hypothetical protein